MGNPVPVTERTLRDWAERAVRLADDLGDLADDLAAVQDERRKLAQDASAHARTLADKLARPETEPLGFDFETRPPGPETR